MTGMELLDSFSALLRENPEGFSQMLQLFSVPPEPSNLIHDACSAAFFKGVAVGIGIGFVGVRSQPKTLLNLGKSIERTHDLLSSYARLPF